MFVRDSNNNPIEISKIFVRDAAGNPQEICKVYVRDSNGNPVLVYECQPIIAVCPQCVESSIIPFYYSIAESSTESILVPRFSFPTNYPANPSTPCDLGVITPFLGQDQSVIPASDIEVDKTYWSNIGQYSTYTLGPHEQTLSSNTNPFLVLRKFNLPPTCEFCQNVDIPTQQWFNDPQYYWKKLKEGYDSVTNYPLIPGHIVVDWNTLFVRDTVYVLMKPLQRIFNKICTHPNSLPDAQVSSSTYCFHLDGENGNPPVNVVKYPLYNRPILMRFYPGNPTDLSTSFCGQEMCSSGLWGTLDWSGGSTCYGGFHSSGSIFFNLPGFPTGSVGDCDGGPITSSGSATITPDWCSCCGYCCQNPQVPGCEPQGIGDPCCCDDGCDCVNYFNQTYTGPTENPFSFVLNVQDHGTDRMLPVPTSSGAVQDCCTSTCYGPVRQSNTKKACREVYQIPPINTGPFSMVQQYGSNDPYRSSLTDPFTDALGFFKDMTVAVLMDSTALMNSDDPSGSVANVRLVLPYYVQLHDSLRSHMVYVQSSNYDNFINDGNGPVNNPAAYSVWNTISKMFGIKVGTGSFNVDSTERIWMSSTAFAYNEFTDHQYWFNVGAPFSRIAGTVTEDQKPGLWWNIKGYPTEKTTHYVVLELRYSGNRCITTLFDEGQLTNLTNQKNIVLGLRFYPVERACPNNKNYKHPIYQTYIIPDNYQKYCESGDEYGSYFGYVDGWSEDSNTWFEAPFNCGGGGCAEPSPLLNTFAEKDFWVYQENSVLKTRCLVYPRLKTFGRFLSKYYRVPST